MADIEKVIKAIEDCVFHKIDCVDCDYDGCVFKHGDCRRDLLADALALLKEQERKDKMFNALEGEWKRLKELLKEQEAVVRCKDCMYGEQSRNAKGEKMVFCYNGDTGIEDGYLHEPEWFCAEGERK